MLMMAMDILFIMARSEDTDRWKALDMMGTAQVHLLSAIHLYPPEAAGWGKERGEQGGV